MTKKPASLPLLDIRQFYSNPSAFVEELRLACHKVGFFLLRHDIPNNLATRQLDETIRFFQHHSLNEKETISYEDQPSFRGYMRLGVENTAGVVDLREQIEYAATYQHTKRKWPPYERLKAGANPWPNFQPSLRSTTEAYVPHVCRIADCVRSCLCLALGLHADALDSIFGSSNGSEDVDKQPHWVLKLISYPVVQPKYISSSTQGVGEHTDTNFLTMVLQDDVGGLQVFSQGDWIDVPSEHGSNVLVCNLGEQAEILSRGYFLATPHRVLANTSSTHARVSVPLFYNPCLSATIQPLETLANLKWERKQHDHWRRPRNAMLATVGDNTFKSLARSHPAVFRRHHPDLSLQEDGSIIRKETNQV